MDNVSFTACKYLDFDRQKYGPSANMNLISSGNTTKVVWDRRGPTGNQLAQFCSTRGRINAAEGCLEEDLAYCGDYEDFNHCVPLATIELEL